jgi:hypothetical protein
MAEAQRRLYQGNYRTTLEDPDTPQTLDVDDVEPATPEEKTWKNRYGDLRRHNNSLNDRVKELENQLTAAHKKEIKIPSSPQELEAFARSYPDVFRNIRSIVLTELMQEKEHITQQTEIVKEDLDRIKRERGMQKILQAHPDFEEVNLSEDFHTWASTQPKDIQDWMFESSNPDLCIRALDLYKADRKVTKRTPGRPRNADIQINPRGTTEPLEDTSGKKVWRASEIAKLHPKQFEKMEAEIMLANREGRVIQDA